MILRKYKDIINFATENEAEAQKYYAEAARKVESAAVDIGFPEVW